MSNTLKVLAVGDIVGKTGTGYIVSRIRKFREENLIDLVVANGENSAPGNGILPDNAKKILDNGVDIMTGGNHTWHRKEFYDMLDTDPRIIRPANYPAKAEGNGYTYAEAKGYRILCMNVAGTAFMEPVDSPFLAIDHILEREEGNFDFSLLDIHAEATSEKIALARYFDSRINIIFGTHTHVPTADCQILPGGTGYITDLGMCGSHSGVLGVDNEDILHKFLVKTPVRFRESTEDVKADGAIFEIDIDTGKCICCEGISF